MLLLCLQLSFQANDNHLEGNLGFRPKRPLGLSIQESEYKRSWLGLRGRPTEIITEGDAQFSNDSMSISLRVNLRYLLRGVARYDHMTFGERMSHNRPGPHDGMRPESHARQDDGVRPYPGVMTDDYRLGALRECRVHEVMVGRRDANAGSDVNLVPDEDVFEAVEIDSFGDAEQPHVKLPGREIEEPLESVWPSERGRQMYSSISGGYLARPPGCLAHRDIHKKTMTKGANIT